MKPVLGVISLLGAGFLVFLGYGNIRYTGSESELEDVNPQSIKKGVIANFLNPHPYMFWFSIGAPTVLKAMNVGVSAAILFLSGFYFFLVCSKMLVAVVAGKSRRLLKSRGYIYVNRGLGILLIIFAAFFLRDGLISLGII
jgi:threonine/homoserine/homoserine lactone efflux protein